MSLADERQQVMFAETGKCDVLHQTISSYLTVNTRRRWVRGSSRQPSEKLGIHPGHAGRRLPQPFAVHVFADGFEDFADRRLDPGQVHGRLNRRSSGSRAGIVSRRVFQQIVLIYAFAPFPCPASPSSKCSTARSNSAPPHVLEADDPGRVEDVNRRKVMDVVLSQQSPVAALKYVWPGDALVGDEMDPEAFQRFRRR